MKILGCMVFYRNGSEKLFSDLLLCYVAALRSATHFYALRFFRVRRFAFRRTLVNPPFVLFNDTLE